MRKLLSSTAFEKTLRLSKDSSEWELNSKRTYLIHWGSCSQNGRNITTIWAISNLFSPTLIGKALESTKPTLMPKATGKSSSNRSARTFLWGNWPPKKRSTCLFLKKITAFLKTWSNQLRCFLMLREKLSLSFTSFPMSNFSIFFFKTKTIAVLTNIYQEFSPT